MELLAIRLARFVLYISTEEINPRGRVFIPDVPDALVERYKFVKRPMTLDDYDETKGITFEGGRWNDISIDRLVMYRNGFMLDTRSSTNDSEKILNDVLKWGSDTFGFVINIPTKPRKLYASEVLFHSDISIDLINSEIYALAARATERVHEWLGQKTPYQTFGISFSTDSFIEKFAPPPFRIERLLDAPFTDNKYFSTAPLPTNEHLQFLTDFESALARR